MKALLIGLLAIGSLSSYAALDSAVFEQASRQRLDPSLDLKTALIQNLQTKSFDCSYSLGGVSSAKTKSDVLSVLSEKKTTAKVESDLNQPVIATRTARTDTMAIVFNITTSEDFKEVTKVELLMFEEKMVQVNVGTLVRPVFESKLIREDKVKAICEVY